VVGCCFHVLHSLNVLVRRNRWSRKPSSVRLALTSRAVIYLGSRSPETSCGLPATQMVRTEPRCLFGLAPTGGYRAAPVTSCAVSSYLTISPLPPLKREAVYFLWPFPSSLDAQALPGSLSFGARTFLSNHKVIAATATLHLFLSRPKK
jgi:hypothetical protein